MSAIQKSSAEFTGYDYKEISAGGEQLAFYLDCYESFGWVQDERTQGIDPCGKGKIILKRERKIMNKAELTRLQRHFEACVEEIGALEQSKTTGACIAALCVGLAGTVFMALSVFAVVHVPPLFVLSVILAVPGFLGWLLPWFLYRKMVFRRSQIVVELEEKKYDEIDEICEQGSRLLNV